MATRISSSVPAATWCLGRLWNVQGAVAAVAESAKNAQVTPRREARGSGAVRFASRGFPGYATSMLFKMKSSCATQRLLLPGPVNRFSLFTAFAYCPVADCGWPEKLIVLGSSRGPLRSTSFG